MPRIVRAPYPFVPAERLEFHFEAAATWDRLLTDLKSARKRLWIENYILEDGEAADAVCAALKVATENGAKVRMMLDAVGSHRMSAAMKQRLVGAGVELKLYNPVRLFPVLRHGLSRYMSRTHRRIIVIDGQVAWTGGLAISDRWWPGEVASTIRDSMLRMEGELVGQMALAFDVLWRKQFFLRKHKFPAAKAHEARVILQVPSVGMLFRRDLYRMMAQSKQRLWLATPYFIPSPKFSRTLRRARRLGTDVRLLLPGPVQHDHPAVRFAARRYYTHLLVAGVRIFEYQPAFMHSKIALFDHDWVALGSANLDRWSFFVNHELMISAHSSSLNDQVAQHYQANLEQSHEITLEEWRKRSLWNRLLERFFGLFDRMF
jgi:cardiolipin synthase A/B